MLDDITNRHGVKIEYKPIDLNPVVDATSGEAFGYRSQAHRDYFFDREIERWSEHRDAPLINHRPTWHDEPLDLPNGCVIAAGEMGFDQGALAHAILRAHWLEDANHTDPDILTNIANSLDIPAQPLLDLAGSERIQKIHAEFTQDAIARSVFGSPTYFVNGDMFYGQDRLELVERAILEPYSGTWPK